MTGANVTAGCSATNAAASSSSTGSSDAAAKTVTSPDSVSAEAVAEADDAAAPAPPPGVASPPTPPADEPQPASASSATPAAIVATTPREPTGRVTGHPGRLDEHRRGLDHRRRARADLEAELAHRLARHERDHAERPALQLDLRHDRVGRDRGDEPGEPVAGRRTVRRRVVGRGRAPDRERREVRADDHGPSRRVGGRRQRPRLDPAAHGVVAHAEQLGGLADPEMRHGEHSRTADAVWRPRSSTILRQRRRTAPRSTVGRRTTGGRSTTKFSHLPASGTAR